VLGQQAAEEKSNEITAIPLLLKPLDLKGALVEQLFADPPDAPYRAQSALKGQTDHQSEEPAETGWLECRLSGNRHPSDRLTFKRFPL
jgi:hypothetical protein